MEVNDICTPGAEEFFEMLAGLGVVPGFAPGSGWPGLQGEDLDAQLRGLGAIHCGLGDDDADGMTEILQRYRQGLHDHPCAAGLSSGPAVQHHGDTQAQLGTRC